MLNGTLQPQRLARAIQQLSQRQQILCTVYSAAASAAASGDAAQARQQVQAYDQAPLAVHDLSDQPAAAQQAQLQQLIAAARQQVFNLNHVPVMQLHYVQQSAHQSSVIFAVHHIAFDGQSATLFARELAALYEERELPALPWQYRDYARYERQYWNAETLAPQLAFWRDYLQPVLAPPINGALDLGPLAATATATAATATTGAAASPAAATGSAHSHSCYRFNVDQSALQGVQQLAREQQMTLFMLGCAAYSLVLSSLCEQTRFCIGTDVAGRHLAQSPMPRCDGLIGFFVNQLPLLCPVDDEQTLAAWLQQCRTQILATYQHQALPWEALVSQLAPPRIPGRAPVFQVKFNYQPEQLGQWSLGGAALSHYETYQSPGVFDLVMDLVHGAQGLDARLEYRAGVLDEHSAQDFARLWQDTFTQLPALLQQPATRVGDYRRALRERYRQYQQQRQQQQQQTLTRDDRGRIGSTRRRSVNV